MKIIAGTLKGRRVTPAKGIHIRPTSGKIKESIFNILSSQIEYAYVLDLFAGSGSLGIEALSRKAKMTVFVDYVRKIEVSINRNLHNLSLNHKSIVIKHNILKNLDCLKSLGIYFDIVFIDPPYNQEMIKPTLANLIKANILNAETCIVIEHSPKEIVPKKILKFILFDQRNYNNSIVSFLSYVK